MENKPKRVKGIAYSSSLSLVPKKREWIVDPDGYYKELGLDPNAKNWGSHEIKDSFRKLIKKRGHEPKLIKAYKTLISTERVDYDSLKKTMERYIEEVSTGKRQIKTKKEKIKRQPYAYFVDNDNEENEELSKKWMQEIATYYHRLGIEKSVRVVLSDHFEQAVYPWGELIYVDVSYEPDIAVLAYHLLKDTKDNWYLDYCKVSRKWE